MGLIAFVSSRDVCLLAFVSSLTTLVSGTTQLARLEISGGPPSVCVSVFRLFITRVKKSPDWENTVIRNRPANPLLGLRAIPTANPSHDHPNVNFQPSIP